MSKKRGRNILRLVKTIVFLPLTWWMLLLFPFTNKSLIRDIEVNRYFRTIIIIDLLVLLTCNIWFRTLYAHRLGPILGKIFTSFVPVDRSFVLSYSCRLGGGLTLYHPFATIINGEEVGMDVVIRNGITIGNVSHGENTRPIVGDRVVFGVNVSVFGGVIITNDVFLGAGTQVFRSITRSGTYINPKELKRLR